MSWTPRLVADNQDMIEVSGGIAGELREMADSIGDATSIVCIVLDDDGSPIRVLGEDLTDFELIGILEAAKSEALRDLLDGE